VALRSGPALAADELVIVKNSRALLWHDHGTNKTKQPHAGVNEAHGTFEHAVDMKSCLLLHPDLKTQSVVCRVYTDEQSTPPLSLSLSLLLISFMAPHEYASCLVCVMTKPDPLALRYVPARPEAPVPNGVEVERDVTNCGYFKVVSGCQYYLNLTL
jgi:hypothetical protein